MKFVGVCFVFIALPILLLNACSNGKPVKKEETSNPDSLAGKSVYHNPTDGKTYHTDGGFIKYEPEGGVPSPREPKRLEQIVLLTDDPTIARVIGVEKLAACIEQSKTLVLNAFADSKEEGEMLLQISIFAAKPPGINISLKGDLKDDKVNTIYKQLEVKCKDYRTSDDSCVYQLHFVISNK